MNKNNKYIIDSDNTLNALYQFLYSYRDNVDDDIPDYNSQNARDAMEKLMEIRDKVSSSNVSIKKYINK